MDDFEDFYAASRDAVFRAVLAATGARTSAEDAVAEAYARAYARWATVATHPNPVAWVLRTALNVHRSWWRRVRREVPGAVIGTAMTDAQPADPDLRALVAALPRRQREVVALRLLADLSAEETAELLGVAVATVHVHLHRALAALRAQLPPQERAAPLATPRLEMR